MKPFTLNHVVVQQLVFKSIDSFTCVWKTRKWKAALSKGKAYNSQENRISMFNPDCAASSYKEE